MISIRKIDPGHIPRQLLKRCITQMAPNLPRPPSQPTVSTMNYFLISGDYELNGVTSGIIIDCTSILVQISSSIRTDMYALASCLPLFL